MTRIALIVVVLWAGAARAQTPNCDFAQGDVDLFVNMRFEDFKDCPTGSGIPCTQGPGEQDLVGWGVTLQPGPGTSGDSGTTNGTGDVAWTGNGALTNTCVHHGQHTVTLSVPSPSPYSPEANWPTNLTFTFFINSVDPQSGQNVERFFLTVFFTCTCDSDGDACTLDTCSNGLCLFPQAAFDPTKPEVCNDQDDDCDGDTDEGLPPTAPECTTASAIGCADKTREGFMDWADFPLIASCGGAWDTGGVDGPATCNRAAGNFGTDAVGTGCSAADLCPAGWHICYGPEDVAQRLGAGDCSDALDPFYPNFGSGAVAAEVSVPPGGAFFASAAVTDGAACDEGVNNGAGVGSTGTVYGCGNMGIDLPANACGFFDRIAGPLCDGLQDLEPKVADDPASDFGYVLSSEWAWSCGSTAGDELVRLEKRFADRQGGVLCCKDTDASLAEVCDGVDNDADTLVDETVFGGVSLEAGDICQSGQQCGDLTCTPNGGWTCANLRGCADVTCDDVDDDEDGQTDEEYVETPTTCGVGVCAATGALTCDGGDEVDTCEPGAADEANDVTCDGADGDCDGDTDEDFVASDTTCGLGACAATGVRTCAGGVGGDTCTPGAKLAESDGTCDDVDDDCDGATDDDAPPHETSCGLGMCQTHGTEVCVGGVYVDSCTPPEPTVTTDTSCDGLDNDCDGTSDEDFASVATTCGVGACAGNTGVATCAGGAPSDTCDPLEGAVTETCDGSDDDCDGATDEGFEVGVACDGEDADACENGTTACGDAGTVVCDEGGDGQTEVCDGADNDCDGQTDEGLTGAGCTDCDDDTVPDSLDNCVDTPNTDQADSDGDGAGNACDVVAQGGACQGGGLEVWAALVAIAVLGRRALRVSRLHM